jgi:hypothetical protein
VVVRNGERGIKFWDLDNRQALRTVNWPMEKSENIIAVARDLGLALVKDKDVLRLANLETGALHGDIKSYGSAAEQMIVSPPTGLVLMRHVPPEGRSGEANLRLWRVDEVNPRQSPVAGRELKLLSMTSDGRTLLMSGERNELVVVSGSAGEERHRFVVSGLGKLERAVISPDGSVADRGTIHAGSASLWVPYVGVGTYTVRVAAWRGPSGR